MQKSFFTFLLTAELYWSIFIRLTVGLVKIRELRMRIIKDADERKNEILDAADELFSQKGFDGTSISDILQKVKIARGTLYYHFKSKEEIMDALIERYNTMLLAAAKEIAEDKTIPVFERLLLSIMAMNMDKDGDSKVLEHMHKPQNALMHQKTHKAMLEGIPPILTEIIKEGIEEGILDTPYPYESIELSIAYINAVFDNDLIELTEEETFTRIKAFIFNIERILGAEPGSFVSMVKLFGIEEGERALE